MFLLPVAHESQRAQRYPWVTFILLGINLILLLYTEFFGGVDENALNAKLSEYLQYLSAHPYLEVRPDMKQYLGPEDEQQLQSFRERTPTSNQDQNTIDSQQKDLNRMADEIVGMTSENPFKKWGYIPREARLITMITYMFLHAGWVHLLGNMLFLYLAGCSIEDLWGRPVYIAFYLVSGVVSAWFFGLRFPDSVEPLVGASGAIAGLMGAFAIRLYKTKITFVYVLWVFRLLYGTFQAPAYLVLPLWLLQQLLEANMGGDSGVAFHAHIGGFIFGALVALAMKYSGVEEKYLAPAIEKKVSLEQNPLFLQAIEKSEARDYASAQVLLEKVVRQEPNHLDALMEMRRIAEISKDEAGYTKYTGGILDALVRTKEGELLRTVYNQFLERPDRHLLPAKTLFGVAGFFEEEHEPETSLRLYDGLTTTYPDDPLSMKAWSKMSRIHFEKQNNPEKGRAALLKAYDHKHSSEQWRFALQTDLRRHGIELPAQGRPSLQIIAPPAADSAPQQQSSPAVPSVPTDAGILPNPVFDGDTSADFTIVPCQVQKIVIKGIMLSNEGAASGVLQYKSIRYLSSGRIKEQDILILDLVVVVSENPKKVLVYRLQGRQMPFSKIFPLLEQTVQEAFQNFTGIIANNSRAVCLPDRDQCLGPAFAQYLNVSRYDSWLREKMQ